MTLFPSMVRAIGAVTWLAGAWLVSPSDSAPWPNVGPALAAEAPAAASSWTARTVAGEVRARPDSSDWTAWRNVRPGERLDPMSQIETGRDGTVELVRDGDVIRLSADSGIRIAAPAGDGVTRILQRLGKAFFDVARRPGWEFSVETPFLVALVKGTSFDVSVGTDGAAVSVSEGAVAVSRGRGTEGRLIEAGASARVSSAPDAAITFEVASSDPANTGTSALAAATATPTAPARPAAATDSGTGGWLSAMGMLLIAAAAAVAGLAVARVVAAAVREAAALRKAANEPAGQGNAHYRIARQ